VIARRDHSASVNPNGPVELPGELMPPRRDGR
jgi:hypothetical protein